MNIFYKMDLEISDLENELWTKIENIGPKNEKSVLVSKMDFWGRFQDQNDFLKYSGARRSHPGSVSTLKTWFQINFVENRGKPIKIKIFV